MCLVSGHASFDRDQTPKPVRTADKLLTVSKTPSPDPPSQYDTLRLAAIVNTSDDAIVSKDLNGIVMSWNRAAERMFGYTAEEAIGRSIRIIVPADRQDEEDHVLARIRQGLPVEHFETIRQRKDGTQFPISLTVSPMLDSSGKVIGASKIARDITERKEAEQLAQRATLHTAFLSQLSVSLGHSLNYEETLKAVAHVTVPQLADFSAVDVALPDGELKRLATAHVDPRKIDLANQIRSRHGGDMESPNSPEYVIRTATPALIPLITDEMLVASSQGDEERLATLRALGLTSYLCVPILLHTRAVGAITMATAGLRRRYTQEDLRFAELVAARAALAVENSLAYEQLQAANRLKDEFLATLSHELRTPLNAVLGYARMLRLGVVKPEKTQHALDVLERNATALTQIVEDVLDVSRIISGKVRLHMRPVSLAKVTSDAVATVQPAADAKNVHLECNCDVKVGAVSGDPDRLQQVIWNLLSNAVKFTPTGGRVQVQVRSVNSDLEIVVRDTGIGIPKQFLPYTFERFRQAESGSTRRQGGLGLGLAIARHIVEMHGGTIEAASDGEGHGSTFTVRLPLLRSRSESRTDGQPPVDRAAQPPPNPKLPDLSRLLVLVVDDDEDALAMMRDMLENASATVVTANSAVEALEIIHQNHPDVLISDVAMPEMDGFDLIGRVRTSTDSAIRNIPAAALTAYARSEDRARSLRAGFEMHLAKPVDPAELAAAVSTLAGDIPAHHSRSDVPE
jgi:PAS domain S-box-containing protein